MGIGIFLAAVLVAAVAGPLAVLRADAPVTQPAQKDRQPTTTSKPAADKNKQNNAAQLPQLRFLAWQDDDISKAWKPNGEPIKDEADLKALRRVHPGIITGTTHGEVSRYLRLWISHPDLDRSASFFVRFMDVSGKPLPNSGGGAGSVTSPRGAEGSTDDLGWVVVTASPATLKDDLPKSVDIVVTYVLEPWRETDTINADFGGPVTVDGYIVTEAKEAVNDNRDDGSVKTTLHYSPTDDDDSRTVRSIVAVTTDGRELSHDEASYRQSITGEKMASLTFYVPRSEIKLFKFQARTVQEVTFQSVSLQPGTITIPMVVAPPDDRPPATTPATNPATKPAAK